MEILKDNYTKVFIEKLIDSNNKLETAIILLKEEASGMIFPVGLEDSFFKYLKNIYNDKNYEEKFLCDIVYKIDKPSSIFIEFKSYRLNSFYINKNNEKITLNLIEILSFAIRYSINIFLDNKLIHPEKKDDYFINADLVNQRKVDLYRLDKVHYENLKH